MKKYIGKIITGIVAVVLIAVAIVEYCMWDKDKTYYEAQIAEYQSAVNSLNESLTGTTGDLTDANKSIMDFKNEIAQMQSDLDAYKKVVDEVNEERNAQREEQEAKKKAEEEAWNALSETQQQAILEGKERAKITTYLLKNNEEYAELYIYMRELSDKGLVELKSSEYKEYKKNKTRMNEIEAEYKATLEAESEPNE